MADPDEPASGDRRRPRTAAAVNGWLSFEAVETCLLAVCLSIQDRCEVIRNPSTAPKLAEGFDECSLLVVEELDRSAVFGRERCLENDPEVVRRGIWRAWFEMLDERLDGFHGDHEVPPVDRQCEVLGDGPKFLEVARQSVDRVQWIASSGSPPPPAACGSRAPSVFPGDVASPKLAARLIPEPANPKPKWQGRAPSGIPDGVARAPTAAVAIHRGGVGDTPPGRPLAFRTASRSPPTTGPSCERWDLQGFLVGMPVHHPGSGGSDGRGVRPHSPCRRKLEKQRRGRPGPAA